MKLYPVTLMHAELHIGMYYNIEDAVGLLGRCKELQKSRMVEQMLDTAYPCLKCWLYAFVYVNVHPVKESKSEKYVRDGPDVEVVGAQK